MQCVSLACINPYSARSGIVVGVQQEINRMLQRSHYGRGGNVTATGRQRNHYGDATKRLLECNGITVGMQLNGNWKAAASLWWKTATLPGSSTHRYDLTHAFICRLTKASSTAQRARYRVRSGTTMRCVSLACTNPCSACNGRYGRATGNQ